MFNSLSGILTAKLPQQIFIDVNGIEWDIAVSDTELALLPPVGSKARIFTWLYHREDSMKLFGFHSAENRALFLDLLKVDGVGARGALKIMSGIEPEQLIQALDMEDMGRLEKVPGIGKKTAQKMLLTLKGKLSFPAGAASRTAVHAQSPWEDVIVALVNMGYDKRRCEETLERIGNTLSSDPQFSEKDKAGKEEMLFRFAIVELAQ